MGTQRPVVRVVFDTNTVVSALLFSTGELAWLCAAWQEGDIVPIVSRATVEELCRVLAYPKFQLTAAEQEELLGEYLPYAQAVAVPADLSGLPQCRDPDDQKFIALAHSAKAEFLLTGDQDLLALKAQMACRIVEPDTFKQSWFSQKPRLGGVHESPAPQY